MTAEDCAGDTLVPAPLTDYVAREFGQVKWRSLGGGVRQAVAPIRVGRRLRVFCIFPPARNFPNTGTRASRRRWFFRALSSDADWGGSRAAMWR